MGDQPRYNRYSGAPGRRSPPVYNPARASLPVQHTPGFALYTPDLHSMTASHHEGLMSRPADDYRTSAVPVSGSSYAVRKDPISRSTSVKDAPRDHRIVDTVASKRPIIITTKHPAPAPRSGSPSRDPYRSSDEGQYYTQPASSIPRGRAVVPFSAQMDDEEYQRLKERTEHDRIAPRGRDTYQSRPAPVYSGPHRGNTLEYEDEGYEYTKPSDLARYDLDHPRRSRRESLDRYYRPTVSVSTDLARPYEPNERRLRGPPPTTWGLDKVNRAPAGGIYDGAGVRMPVAPPPGPLPLDGRRSGLIEAPRSPGSDQSLLSHRPMTVNLLENAPRPGGHYDDYYDDTRDRDRDRDRDRERDHDRERGYFQDDVTSRGFGIRVDSGGLDDPRRPPGPPGPPGPPDGRVYRDERRDRRDRDHYGDREARRRSDEDLEIIRREYDDRDRDRRSHRDYDYDDDFVRDRRDARTHSDDERERDSKKEKAREKVAVGIGLAAASLGLTSALKGGREERERENKDKDDSPSSRYRDEEPERRKHADDDAYSRPPPRKEALLDDEEFEIVEHPKDRERSRKEALPEPGVDRKRVEPETDRRRPDHDAKADADVAATPPRDASSSTEEGKPRVRRRPRAGSAFNPNDTASLAALKAQLAASEDKEKEKAPERDSGSTAREPSPERRSPPVEKRDSDADASAMVVKEDDEDDRGRDLSPSDRQVRVVSPPKDKDNKKPIKGILKQPKPQFPEEPNPVREGVAPHKDDKTKANVPPGARWTKVSRKMVNPEALTIGKERFEVRDDFVIVLRVLSKEEIQAYAAATATLRERRRKELESEGKDKDAKKDDDRDKEKEKDKEDDDERKKKHRQHRRDRDDDDRRDKDRHRRHRYESDDDDDHESRRHSHRKRSD
ncbi:hypothetical protein QBC35DRAFT_484158 [Podospora australis]|uniref:DUF8035 domain-containing protein n=1 Tax=Podospora australis TaxID=1536484 RepID=A0AAN7AKY9_9PEZI|nr:hypothetical protein QBC35DRAFT_484158 [Podospora australis]